MRVVHKRRALASRRNGGLAELQEIFLHALDFFVHGPNPVAERSVLVLVHRKPAL